MNTLYYENRLRFLELLTILVGTRLGFGPGGRLVYIDGLRAKLEHEVGQRKIGFCCVTVTPRNAALTPSQISFTRRVFFCRATIFQTIEHRGRTDSFPLQTQNFASMTRSLRRPPPASLSSKFTTITSLPPPSSLAFIFFPLHSRTLLTRSSLPRTQLTEQWPKG